MAFKFSWFQPDGDKFLKIYQGDSLLAAGISPPEYIDDYGLWRYLADNGDETCLRKIKLWTFRSGAKPFGDRCIPNKYEVVRYDIPPSTTEINWHTYTSQSEKASKIGQFSYSYIDTASDQIPLAAFLKWRVCRIEDSVTKKVTFILKWEKHQDEPVNTPEITVSRHGQLFRITVKIDGLQSAIFVGLLLDDMDGEFDGEKSIAVTFYEWKQLWQERLRTYPWVAENFDRDNPDAWDDATIDGAAIPGWDSPTKAGHLLHQYQREGVEFFISRYKRVLIADEMGLGKTAQAISAAAASNAQRIIVVAPAAVRYGWDREIQGWDAPGKVQHLKGGHDRPMADTRWLICSYDQLVIRPGSWPADEKIVAALKLLVKIGSDQDDDDDFDVYLKGDKIIFNAALPQDLTDKLRLSLSPANAKKWDKLHARLRGETLAALEAWGADLLVLDEAHRVKNLEAKRTKSAISLSRSAKSCIALSGTPIQNRTNEPAVLLRVIDPVTFHEAHVVGRISIERIKSMLKPVYIRRRQEDVLPQLPPLTEQVIDVEIDVDYEAEPFQNILESGGKVPDWAHDIESSLKPIAAAWASGKQIGNFIQLRMQIGQQKAASPILLDTVQEIMESRGKLLIWVHFEETAIVLLNMLKNIWRVAWAYGKVKPEKRKQIIENMEMGDLDIVICSMEAMGEGINLQKCASTAIFIEMVVKPQIFAQARARLHRQGQEHPVHAIYLISNHPVDLFFAEMCIHKASLQSTTLDEKVTIFGQVADVITESVTETPEGDAMPFKSSVTENVTKTDTIISRPNPSEIVTETVVNYADISVTENRPADEIQAVTEMVTNIRKSPLIALAEQALVLVDRAGEMVQANDDSGAGAIINELRSLLMDAKTPRGRGRPKIHTSGAERTAAWRERQRGDTPPRPKGRPPANGTTMTAAERAAAYRARKKTQNP